MPRVRPPFPATKGLWGCPTYINNVETFANVPWIVLQRRRGLHRLGTAEQQGHQGLRHGRQGQARRPGRGADGHLDPGDRLRRLRRHQGGQEVQGGADGRPVGRLHPRRAAGHGHRLRVDQQDRRHHGLGRPRRHGRDHLHGGRGPLLPRLHPARVVRQVHLLPGRHQADAGDPDPHHRGRGAGGRHRAARAARGAGQEQLAVRPRADGAQPGADHAQVLPRRVRGAHHQPEVPGAPVPDAADLHHHRGLQRLRASAAGSARPRRSPARRSRCTSSTSRSASSATSATRPAASTPSSATERGEAAMDLVKLEIDGKRVIADSRQTILEVARENGIDDHPDAVPRRAARAVRLLLPLRGQGARARARCCRPARPRSRPAWWSRPTRPRSAARARPRSS